MSFRFAIIGILVLFPAFAFGQLDRSTPPKPGPAPDIRVKLPEPYTLANGLKVFVVENSRSPKVSISLYLDYDPMLEAEKTGMRKALGELLFSGTTSRSREALNEEIEYLGATFTTSSKGITATGLSRHTPNLLRIMADMALNPNFTEEEFTRVKKQAMSQMALAKGSTRQISNRMKRYFTYGANHPYGELETERSWQNIKLEDCQALYETYFRPNIALLSIAGDVREEEVYEWAEKMFADWEKKEVPNHSYRTPPPPFATRVILVDRPRSPQASVRIAYPLVYQKGDPDEYAAEVLNTIVGGSFSSRLVTSLREVHGFTYGVRSRLTPEKRITEFSIASEIRTAAVDSAISEVLVELRKIREELVPEAELEQAKSILVGKFSQRLEKPETVANLAVSQEVNALAPDYLKHYLKQINSVTAEEVLEVAQKMILPENLNIVIAGDASRLVDKLSAFGEVLKFKPDGTADKAPLSPLPRGTSPARIIERHIAGVGGTVALSGVEDYSLIYEGNLHGTNLKLEIQKKAPNLLNQFTEIGLFSQRVIFDGEKGVTISSKEGRKELNGNNLKSLRLRSYLFPELNYEDMDYDLRIKGVSTVNGKEAIEMEITNPVGEISTHYFDRGSGLRLRVITPLEGLDDVGQTREQVIDFYDYKKVNGIGIPHRMVQHIGNEAIELTASEVLINSRIKKKVFKIIE